MCDIKVIHLTLHLSVACTLTALVFKVVQQRLMGFFSPFLNQ